MKKLGYVYQVHVELEFTREEIEAAIRCSSNHYDALCRRVSTAVPGAFLNGMRNQLRIQRKLGASSSSIETMLSIRDLDLLTKILEPWSPAPGRDSTAAAMYEQCVDELAAANKLQREMNEA